MKKLSKEKNWNESEDSESYGLITNMFYAHSHIIYGNDVYGRSWQNKYAMKYKKFFSNKYSFTLNFKQNSSNGKSFGITISIAPPQGLLLSVYINWLKDKLKKQCVWQEK